MSDIDRGVADGLDRVEEIIELARSVSSLLETSRREKSEVKGDKCRLRQAPF